MISARSTMTASDPSLGDPGSAGAKQADASSKIGGWLAGTTHAISPSPETTTASRRLTLSERSGRASVPLLLARDRKFEVEGPRAGQMHNRAICASDPTQLGNR